jgi:hypothetical protein
VLLVALLLVSYVPRISDALVLGDIRAAREQAIEQKRPPREAWLMECVQSDRSNPLPCSDEEKKKYPNGQMPVEPIATNAATTQDAGAPSADTDATAPGPEEEDLFQKMMGASGAKGGGEAGSSTDAGGAAPAPTTTGGVDSEDELFQKMMGAGKDGG